MKKLKWKYILKWTTAPLIGFIIFSSLFLTHLNPERPLIVGLIVWFFVGILLVYVISVLEWLLSDFDVKKFVGSLFEDK